MQDYFNISYDIYDKDDGKTMDHYEATGDSLEEVLANFIKERLSKKETTKEKLSDDEIMETHRLDEDESKDTTPTKRNNAIKFITFKANSLSNLENGFNDWYDSMEDLVIVSTQLNHEGDGQLSLFVVYREINY